MSEPARAIKLTERRLWGKPFDYWMVNYAVVATLIAMVVFFSIARPETFPTLDTLKTLVTTQSVLAILALGTMVPLIAGEFDLSVSANLSFGAVVSARLVSDGLPVPVVIAAVLAVGLLIGFVNGVLVVKVGLNSFIATLGTGVILEGLASLVAGGGTIYEGIGGFFTDLGNVVLFDLLPIQGLYVLVLAALLWYVVSWTPLGRQLLATGSGRQAARLAGIRTERNVMLAFMVCGSIAALAGLLYTAQLGSATPGVGNAFLLPAYAGAFLGSTTIVAGRFNVAGTLVGVMLLAVGITGLQLMGASYYVTNLFNGTALLVAVSIARWGARTKQTA